MAKSQSKLASSKPVSTKWLQNAMRSIGVSTKNALKNDFAPNLYSAVESGMNTSKSVISSLRRNASGTNSISHQLQSNKYVKFAQTAYKNALTDLRSGNFNNEDRFAESMFDDSGFNDNGSSDSGFSFDDDGADSVNVNIVNASGNNDAMFAMTTHLQKQTEATLKTSQANMNAMIAVNSASMMQIQQIGSLVVSGLDAINKNLSSIIEYNNSNMNKFIESSMAFYERMGTRFDNDTASEGPQKVTAGNIIGASGGINFSQYKQYIKQQFKNSGVGMIADMFDENTMKMLASNPLGFATDAMVKFMIPKVVSNTIKSVEETFSTFMPSLLHKLASWGEGQADGLLGQAKQFIGKMFGVKVDRKDKIDKSAAIQKGPIPFDGQTKHAITEIITKELREQSQYLKIIANHYDSKATNRAKNNSEVFDYKTGKYIKASETTDQILAEIKDSVINTMNGSKFGKTLRGYGSGLKTDDEKQSFDRILDEFMLRLEKHGKWIDLNSKSFDDKDSDYSKLIGSLSSNKRMKSKLDAAIRDMVANNPNAIMDLSNTIFKANNSRNNTISEIQSNPAYYNLFSADGLDAGDLDDLILKYHNRQSSTATSITSTESGGKKKRRSRRQTSIDDFIENGRNGPVGINNPAESYEDGTFSKILSQTGQGVSKMAMGVLHGSFDESFGAFTSMLGEQFKTLWGNFDEKFFTPLKSSIFGTKNQDTNFSEGGIFSGVINSFKDTAGVINHHITGKTYKDSKGNVHESKDGSTSVVGNLKKIGSDIKQGIMKSLFGGDEIIDKDGNPTGKIKGGLLGGFKETINEGLIGWQEALFGKKLDDKEKENLKQSMIKNLEERLPNTVTGAAVGAGVGMMSGGLLGTLIGGPIGGAAFGTAFGFLSKSEKFQNFLFGEKDENGDRVGGFISKKVQDYFKKNKKSLGTGAAVGAVAGGLTGGGVLGTLVGGPVAGAILGVGTSILAKSETFKEFLYGSEKTGQKGVIQSIASLFNKSNKDNADTKGVNKKALGMGMLGAGAGALSVALISKMGILGAAFTPMGPVGGALLGLGMAIKANKDTFHTWLFGEKDENGNKTKEGVLGQFGNMLKVSVLNPIKSGMISFAEDIKLEVKYHILDNIRFAIEPFGNLIKDTAGMVKDKITSIFTKLGDSIANSKIIKGIDEYIISPIRGLISGVTKVVWGVTKRIITAPFRLIGNISKLLTNRVKATFDKFNDAMHAHIIDPMKDAVKKHIIEPIKKTFKSVFGFFGKGIKGIFNFIGGTTSYLGDKLLGVGGEDKESPDAGGIKDSVAEQRKLRAQQYRIEKSNKKKHDRERRIHDQNSIAIARATNYQLTEDTEENRKIAKAAGAKINERVAALESSKTRAAKSGATTEGMSHDDLVNAPLDKLSDEGKQTSLLAKIYDLLKIGVYDPEDDVYPEDRDNTKEKVSDKKSDTDNKDDDSDATLDTEPKLTGAEKIRKEIEDAGGLKDYFAGKLTGARERVSSIYANTKSWVGGKVNQISGLLERFKGKGHANGTEDTGDESAIVGESGPELVNFSKGNKVYANSKPLQVTVVGVANKVRNLFARIGGKKSTTETDTDSGDVRSIATRLASSSGSGAAEIISDLHGNSTGEQHEDDMNAIATSLGAKNRLDAARDAGYTELERQEMLDKEEEKAKLSAIAENTERQAEGQEKHSSLWSSIFSKKGLITGLAIAAVPLIIKHLPQIVNFVKNVASSVGNIIKRLSEHFGWTSKNAALGDGDRVGDKISENVDRVKGIVDDGNFILNEDGQWDHMSGANAKIVSKAGTSIAKSLGKFAFNAKTLNANAVTALASKKNLSVDDVAKLFNTTSDDVVSQFGVKKNIFGKTKKLSIDDIAKGMGTTVADASDMLASQGNKNAKAILSSASKNSYAAKAIGSNIDNVGTKVAASTVDDVAEVALKSAGKTVVKAGTKGGAEIIEQSSKGLLKRVIDMVTNALNEVGEKAAAKAAKKAGSKAAKGGGKLFAKIIPKLKNVLTKHFPKITAKITAIFAGEGVTKALYAVAGIGAVIDIVQITSGALNGLTGAARLFYVDSKDVDWMMRIISGTWGALANTSLGALFDVINELCVSTIGFDFISEASFAIYKFLMETFGGEKGKAKVEKIEASQEEFRNEYVDYKQKELEKQFETQKKAGMIGSDVTYEQFAQGVDDGKYKVKYDSFADYNDKQHQTAAAKVGGAIGKGFKALGKGIAATWTFRFGKTTKYLEDDNGNKYYDNKDGTYQIISASGEDLGFISKEALPESLIEKKERKKGIYEKVASSVASGVKNFFVDHKKSAYFATDGTYYDNKGTHFSASGEKIGKISKDELKTMISSGLVTEGEIDKKAGIKVLGSKIGDAVKKLGSGIAKGWNAFTTGAKKVGTSIKESATKVWNKVTSIVSNKASKVKNFLFGKKTSAWYDADGGYYLANGDAYDYYNSNGDIITSGVSSEDVSQLINSGTLTEGEVKLDSTLKTTVKKILNVKINAFKKVGEIAAPIVKSIGDTAKTMWDNIKTNGLFGSVKKFFSKQTTTAWFDPNGNYYKNNGDTYDYYNANNDLIESGIDAGIVNEKIQAGLLTKSEITTDSAAKSAIKNIKDAVSNAWKNAKETVSSGWNKFTSWLKGGNGNITAIDKSNYGQHTNVTGNKIINGNGGRGVPYYSQNDSNWAKNAYGNDGATMADSGCGPTAMAMVTSNLTGKPISPMEMARLSEFAGTRDTSGTNSRFIDIAANTYGINSTQLNNPNAYALYKAASNGPTILLGQNSKGAINPFTSAGHYVVTDGVDSSGNILVKDPRGMSYNKKYSAENLANTTGSMWGFGKNPFGGKGRRLRGGRDGEDSVEESSDSSSTDILTSITSFFSEAGNRALTGMMTGNWNSDYSDYISGTPTSSSSATTTSNVVSNVTLSGNSAADKIWNYYKSMGIPDNTIAGMLANMYAESGLNSNNLQNTYENKLGHTDSSYTAAVDNGTYNNFVNDAAGYGLVQWTYHSLKNSLLKYAKSKGASIGDMGMQLEFLAQQLANDYPSTWQKMVSAASPEDASTIMLKEFEKPAVLNTAQRANYARQYYNLYGGNGTGAKIKPRIVKAGNVKSGSGSKTSIDSILSGLGSGNDYTAASTATKYIENTSNRNMTKAINMIISLLEAITGNTATASQKLDMLENIRNTNVVNGGNTTNYMTNNGTNTVTTSSNPITSKSNSGPSRNQRIAEKIAQGV